MIKIAILAYVDPGLGTLAWQMVISSAVGLAFYLKETRNWIIRTLAKIFHSK